MKRRIAMVSIALFGLAALMGSAEARVRQAHLPSVHLPSVHLPSVHLPSVHLPSVHLPQGRRCNAGFNRTRYNGRDVCVRCNAGFNYTRYNGRDVCVRCDAGFNYTRHGCVHVGGKPVAAATTAAPAGYIGCYKDTSARDLSLHAADGRNMNTGLCLATCRGKGFAYGATQYGSHCFCGNSYGKHGKATNCDMKCAGNAGQICGGYWANSVYRIR